ncbi:MAG: 2'-5' RNA ligase family protein [Candidatus Micrarchaeota archaeon]|nr:2'-5' RNA ligase family protein [Candidatus Micrarchaeota archaeon]
MPKIFILSIINDDKKLTKLFKDFERKYNGVQNVSDNYPHITFQSGETKNLQKIEKELKKISSEKKPIKIEITRLTNWSKEWIYYKIKKTSELASLNRIINNILKSYGKKLANDYKPRLWVPHIAVGNKVQKSKFHNAFNEVSSKNIKKVHRLNSIYIVEETPTGRFKTIRKYTLFR